jgi:hypothetical protein
MVRCLLLTASMLARVTLMLAMLASCGVDGVSVVHKTDIQSDTGTAIDRYVAAGKTAEAFAGLAAELRTSDVHAARDAELRLLALAYPLVAAEQPCNTDVLTVWPALLDAPLTEQPNREIAPRAGEDAARYATRLCRTALESQCGDIAPDARVDAVRAIAIRHADARMHAAVAATGEARAWNEIGWKWEHLARAGGEASLAKIARPTGAPIAAL